MGIRVYNSLTNRKEPFETVVPGKVGIYLCGPTVYKPSHIGHAVGPVIFDTIKRYLTFRGYAVTFVVNITDVEDKLIIEAAAQGVSVAELAARVTKNYTDALTTLRVTGVDQFPKASEHIDDIIAITQRLIEAGAAYPSGGDVYFNVTADEDYGKLSNRTPDEQAGQRDLNSGPKRHPGDFALWKAAKPEEPEDVKYDSPWGKGRPGWHIECSAMAMKILGETFDIHGGGLDLIFPHHENEIAQSETCTGKPFARYWLHNGLTRFNTKKVSKSDPEMQAALERMTLSNLFGEYSGELLRYFILSTHYRRPIEYSPEEIESKKKGLHTFYRLFDRITAVAGASPYEAPSAAALEPVSLEAMAPESVLPEGASSADPVAALLAGVKEAHRRFLTAMDDDFNTAAAIAALFELANGVNRFIEQVQLETHPAEADRAEVLAAGRTLIVLGRLLGLFFEPPVKIGAGDNLVEKVMKAHVAVRAQCRAGKHFEFADRIRDGLNEMGVGLEDKPSGTVWHLTAEWGQELADKLLQLHVDVRRQARDKKNFAVADIIRDRLLEAGVTLEDKPTGTIWTVEGG